MVWRVKPGIGAPDFHAEMPKNFGEPTWDVLTSEARRQAGTDWATFAFSGRRGAKAEDRAGQFFSGWGRLLKPGKECVDPRLKPRWARGCVGRNLQYWIGFAEIEDARIAPLEGVGAGRSNTACKARHRFIQTEIANRGLTRRTLCARGDQIRFGGRRSHAKADLFLGQKVNRHRHDEAPKQGFSWTEQTEQKITLMARNYKMYASFRLAC